MVLQVKDYGAFRHQPSTAWFVSHSHSACAKTPKGKSQEKQSDHSQAKHVSRIARTRRSGVVNIRYIRESHSASSQRLRCFQAPTEHCVVRDSHSACAQNTERKVAREAIATNASKAREYKCEEREVRRHEKQRFKSRRGPFRSSREKSRV